MKFLFSFILFLLSSFAFSQRYGALIQPPYTWGAYDFKMRVADSLQVDCIRDAVILGEGESPKSLTSAYGVVLNVNTGQPMWSGAVAYVSDTNTYKKDLQLQINLFSRKPLLLVLENEETNEKYHKGDVVAYANELRAGAGVAHANGLKVTNAGLMKNGVQYCMYQSLLAAGNKTGARDFASRNGLAVRSAKVQRQGAMVRTLLDAYKRIDIDYVNLHFYSTKPADVAALEDMCIYLEEETGKPVITNEVGQDDFDPETVSAVLASCRKRAMAFVVWYSGTGDGGHAKPLHRADGSLYSNGTTFKKFVAGERAYLR